MDALHQIYLKHKSERILLEVTWKHAECHAICVTHFSSVRASISVAGRKVRSCPYCSPNKTRPITGACDGNFVSTLLGFFSSFPKITSTFREVWFSCIWFYFSQGKIRYVISTWDNLGNTPSTQPRIKIWMLCAHLKPVEGFLFVFWRHLS